MPESMLVETNADQAPFFFLAESGSLSAILALLITRRRRVDHMLLIFITSPLIAFVAFVALLIFRSVLHR
jgi:hypothetical protein